MPAHWLSKLLALALAVTPAAAQEAGLSGGFTQPSNNARPQNETVTLTRGTCVTDTANATTYNSAGFQATGTGAATATETYYPVVVVLAEDNAATFGINSMTINGVPAIEVIDEDGTGIVDAALYRGAGEISGTTINVSVTASEALAGSMTVCAWALKNLQNFTPTSSVQDDDTAEGVLVLTTPTTTSGGFVVGGCINSGVASTTTWAVITEREDTQNAEHDYSNADGAATGASMANTCDWSANTNDASGVAAAFR
jgi:hypothetical protein